MTFNEYQALAMRTSRKDMSPDDHLLNGALGLTGESGEVADMVKKCFMQGHDMDFEHLAKELGDILWYVAEAATSIDMDMDTIARMNIEKLNERYPDGFDPEKSQHRKDGDI